VSVSSTDEELSTESVIDAIALIESQRQDLKREPDAEAWRKRALGTLEEILRRLEEAARLHGSSAERHANAQAVRNQIARVQARAVPGQRPAGETTRGRRRQKPPPPGSGARSMGRRNGR
jgi:hypothetical protein